jgi:hypothetical protein
MNTVSLYFYNKPQINKQNILIDFDCCELSVVIILETFYINLLSSKCVIIISWEFSSL